jgi:hypothetical protein
MARKRGGDAGPKQAVIEASKEQGGTKTAVSDAVAEAVDLRQSLVRLLLANRRPV